MVNGCLYWPSSEASFCYLPWCHFAASSEQSSEMGVARHITETRKLSTENEAKLELGIQSSIEKEQKEKGKK